MIKNTFGIKGRLRLVCHKKDGSLKWDTGWINNMIHNAGIAELVALAGDVGDPDAFTYLALSTDNTGPAAGDTTLTAEITTNDLERVAATVTRQTSDDPGIANDTLQLTHMWTADGSQTIEKMAIFDVPTAPVSGVMLASALTGTKAVDEDETLTGTYQITFARP